MAEEETIVISSDEEELEITTKHPRLSSERETALEENPSETWLSGWNALDSDSFSEEDDTYPAVVKTVKSPVKKRQQTVRDEPQKFLHGLSILPIYSQSSKQLNTIQCINILLDPDLSSNLLCTTVPFDINCNLVFVIDMSSLPNVKDITCDDMGVWRWKGSYRRWFSIDETGYAEILGKTLEEVPDDPHYRIWKRFYVNRSSTDLNKMIVTMEDSDNDTVNLALLQYTFLFKEHSVKIAPHGNSKKSESYTRTMPSVMSKLKTASSINTAKRALSL